MRENKRIERKEERERWRMRVKGRERVLGERKTEGSTIESVSISN